MKSFNNINPNVKWIAGVFTVIGLLVFSAGYTINNAFSDDDRIIVKIMKIHDGDTTIIEREFSDLDELEMLEHEMNGEDLHKLGMHMWFFGDEHDSDKHKEKHDFKFMISHGDSSTDRRIQKKIIVFSDGDTVETAVFNFDMDKMHHMMAKAFHHIDKMDFEFDYDGHKSKHYEFHGFDEEEFEKKMEKMEKHIEKAMGNFQFEFDVEEGEKRTDCRVIVKSYPDDMKHLEEIIENIIIEIKVDQDDVEDGKVVKHIVKIYSDEDEEDEEHKVAPRNRLAISDLNVYPNPGSGKFKIEFELEEKGPTTVEIRDMKGGVVFHDDFRNSRNGSYSKKVNLEESAKGVYILTIKQGDKLANKRLIIR